MFSWGKFKLKSMSNPWHLEVEVSIPSAFRSTFVISTIGARASTTTYSIIVRMASSFLPQRLTFPDSIYDYSLIVPSTFAPSAKVMQSFNNKEVSKIIKFFSVVVTLERTHLDGLIIDDQKREITRLSSKGSISRIDDRVVRETT